LKATIAVPSANGTTQWSVATAHTSTPMMLERFNNRTEEMVAIARVTNDMSPPAILSGDFNCVPWSQYFARLEKDSGMRNSGRGLLPELTWTGDLPPFARIPIDHILVSPQVATQSHEQLRAIGSDHYPIFVKLSDCGRVNF